MNYDVIIVGSGPAGSWLAYNLAQKGINVLILEKEPWSRYKACGGALSGKTLNLLYNQGIQLPETLIENSINNFSFRFGSKKPFSFEYQGQPVKLVNRKYFDAFLLRLACKAGAVFKDNEKMNDINILKDKVIVKTTKNSYVGRFIVGADGANSKTARILELLPEEINKNKGLAIEAEIFINSLDYFKKDRIIIDFNFVPDGYAWVFPKKNQLSIGLGSYKYQNMNIKKKLFEYLKQLKIPYQEDKLFYRGHPIPIAGGVADKIKMAGNRFILVGDAAFLVDPFVGEGIYYSCLSAEIAAKTIIESLGKDRYNLVSYQREIKQELYPELMVASKLAKWFYKNPTIFQKILPLKTNHLTIFMDVIQGESSYNELFKIVEPIL
ncbi:MAG: geranylgeranyl reductase family protein [Halanaerobium sp.]